MQMNFEYNLLGWLVLKYILLCVHKAGDELSRKSVGIKIQVEKNELNCGKRQRTEAIQWMSFGSCRGTGTQARRSRENKIKCTEFNFTVQFSSIKVNHRNLRLYLKASMFVLIFNVG